MLGSPMIDVAIEGAAQGGRDGTGPATDVEHLAGGGAAQHHQAGIAGDTAGNLRSDVDAPGLLDDRLAGVEVHCRSRRCGCRRAGLARFRGNCAERCRGRLAGASQSLRCHVHGHLVTIAGAARIERAGQRALGHQTQRIRTPLRDGGRLVLLRGRRHLLQRRLQGAQHHHAIIVHPRAQRAARQTQLLGIRLRRAVRLPPRPHQPLDLRGGGAAGDGDQARLGGGSGHAREGAHRGVGKPSAGHGRGEVVEIGECCGDAQLFAGRTGIEAGAPVEPMGAGTEALPAMLAIELAQVAQQLVRCSPGCAAWRRGGAVSRLVAATAGCSARQSRGSMAVP